MKCRTVMYPEQREQQRAEEMRRCRRRIAQPGRPCPISETTSFENAENVVKPPRTPVIVKSLSSGGRSALMAKKAAATPIR